jgi:hypothetical protein
LEAFLDGVVEVRAAVDDVVVRVRCDLLLFRVREDADGFTAGLAVECRVVVHEVPHRVRSDAKAVADGERGLENLSGRVLSDELTEQACAVAAGQQCSATAVRGVSERFDDGDESVDACLMFGRWDGAEEVAGEGSLGAADCAGYLAGAETGHVE